MRIRAAVGTGALLLLLSPSGSQRKDSLLPKVTNAAVPFYPELARQTRIQGTVSFRLFTDGKQVSAIEGESGPPLLVKAAAENVRTWEFKPHKPTNFAVTFHYELLPVECDSECHCAPKEKESVLLQLPTAVEVSAAVLMICDPAVTITRPLKP